MHALAIEPLHSHMARVVPSTRPMDLNQALDAVQRLAGAVSVCLFDYRRASSALEVLAGASFVSSSAPERCLRAILEEETSFLLSTSTTRWIASPYRDGQEAILVKIAVQPWGATFLLLEPGNQSASARRELQRLVPDLTSLVRYQLQLVLRLAEAEEWRDVLGEALDHNECGVIAVRADHSIVFANKAGTLHLDGEDGLRVRRGALRPVDHGKAIRFEAALDSVVDPERITVGRRARASVMLLGSRDETHLTIVVIAPAGPRSPARGEARGAAAMVYLLPPAHGVRRGLDTLCELHGLSRVESHLIAHLVEGLTITEAALKMQVKVDTARTYLKQVFIKTGMRRQTDLVTLMTRYMRAIGGDFDFQAA